MDSPDSMTDCYYTVFASFATLPTREDIQPLTYNDQLEVGVGLDIEFSLAKHCHSYTLKDASVDLDVTVGRVSDHVERHQSPKFQLNKRPLSGVSLGWSRYQWYMYPCSHKWFDSGL